MLRKRKRLSMEELAEYYDSTDIGDLESKEYHESLAQWVIALLRKMRSPGKLCSERSRRR